jgi:aminoglycoside phosphotransferase (APT) family kinase protein
VRFELDPADGAGDGFVMERIEGETIARRILRDDAFAAARPRMARQCGEILARIHAIPRDELPALPGFEPFDRPAARELETFSRLLDFYGEPHPAFELGLRWLRAHLPPAGRTTLVHGDFRNGNLVVGPEGVRAVLDWELAHLGDPIEDLGWLCVKAWRFREFGRPVGGFGELADLHAAYEAASGIPLDRSAFHWWLVMGTLKWGVMTITQARAHLDGAVRSVELASIGRRTVEQEYDLLELIAEEE